MEQYYRHCFFVDAGVNVSIGKEVNQLQMRFGFSDEMRKLLLVQSHSKGQPTLLQPFITLNDPECISWYTLDGVDETLDFIERNEDFILSDFLFVFAQDQEGNQYAEITKGSLKGHIVWLNAFYYSDVDSMEELLEDDLEQMGIAKALVDDELAFHLLCTSQQVVAIKAQSLDLFLC